MNKMKIFIMFGHGVVTKQIRDEINDSEAMFKISWE